MEAAHSRPWSDLPPELLGLVLRRLPSQADRVRLRAVCRPWRSNSQLQPLPFPFPWLSLPDGTFLSIPGYETHRIPVPAGSCCHGSIDNWLFLMDNGGKCSLMNPFSSTALELPNLVEVWQCKIYGPEHGFNPIFYKLVVASPLDRSLDSIVAALIMDDGNCRTLCISQPPILTDSFRDDKYPLLHLDDIAFFDGKLYALGGFSHLFICDLDEDHGISSIERIIDSMGDYSGETPPDLSKEGGYMTRLYLAECGGRLLMVERWIANVRPWTSCTSDDYFEHMRTAALEVFEADMASNPGRWRRVNELGGHALFIGQHCTKALPVECCSGYIEDCIYFMSDYARPGFSAEPFRDSGVYNLRDRTIMPLLSGSEAVPPRLDGPCRPTWLFPS